jgi:hypothetical protein
MIQFMIVAVIVGAFTAIFFGVPASLKVGENLITYWILAGFLVMVWKPFYGLVRLVRDVLHKVSGIFRRISA